MQASQAKAHTLRLATVRGKPESAYVALAGAEQKTLSYLDFACFTRKQGSRG